MPVAGGMDIHRKQITFDYLDLVTGEVQRGQIVPADRAHLRAWLGRFAGVPDVAFAFEACTGWRYVAGELARAGIGAHLAEPAGTAAARGRKKRAKTDRADSKLMRELLAQGRLIRNAGSRRSRCWSAGRCWRPIMLCGASTPRGCSGRTRSCSTRAHRCFMPSARRTGRSSWPGWPARTCRRPGSSRSACTCGCWRGPRRS